MRWLHAGWNALRTALGRSAAGLAALLTLAWLLWPKEPWRPDPEPLVAFLLALATWIASLVEERAIPTEATSPIDAKSYTPHDGALLERFRRLMTDNVRHTLGRHDFGGSFRWSSLAGLQTVADWRGAEYEFDDPDLQRIFGPLINDVGDFVMKLATESWLILDSTELATMIPDVEHGGEDYSPRTRQRVKNMNDAASSLLEKIDAFIKLARKSMNAGPV
ncbi:MAG: hypothetical protein AB7M12_06755 [Hyphomonadaceae bacterium]